MQDVVKRDAPGRKIKRVRHRNMSVYYGTVIFIVLVIFVILSVTVFFNVETIIVTGSSIYTAEEIAEASGIAGGDNMIRRNMGKAEEQITEQLIYIETAEITRRFPSSLEICVTPCEETACFDNYDDGYRIISKTGKILASVTSPAEDLPVFYGTEPAEDLSEGMTFASADEDKTEVIYELVKRADSSFGSKITSYDVTDRLNISCIYDNRIEIELGVISDIDYKYRFANEIITTRISPDTEGRLRMLQNGAQLLSKSDLEQIDKTFEFNKEILETEQTSGTDTEADTSQEENTETTKLNFE